MSAPAILRSSRNVQPGQIRSAETRSTATVNIAQQPSDGYVTLAIEITLFKSFAAIRDAAWLTPERTG